MGAEEWKLYAVVVAFVAVNRRGDVVLLQSMHEDNALRVEMGCTTKRCVLLNMVKVGVLNEGERGVCMCWSAVVAVGVALVDAECVGFGMGVLIVG